MNCQNCNVVLPTPTPNTCPSCGYLLVAIPAAFALPKLVGTFAVAAPAVVAPAAVVLPPTPPAVVVPAAAPVVSSKWSIATFVVAMLALLIVAIFAGLWLAKGVTTGELINVAANVQTDVESKIVAEGTATRTAIGTSETNVKGAITATEASIKTAITADGATTRTAISDARKAMRRAIANEATGKATKAELDAAEARLKAAISGQTITVKVK